MATSRFTRFILTDIFIFLLSYLVFAIYKTGTFSYLTGDYLISFGVYLVIWLTSSVLCKKFSSFRSETRVDRIFGRIALSNFIAVSFAGLIILIFELNYFSRLVIFGPPILATLIEMAFAYLYFYVVHTRDGRTDLLNPPPKNYDLRKVEQSVSYHDVSLDTDYIRQAIVNERNEEVFEFFNQHLDIPSNKILCVSTSTRFNIEFQPTDYFTKIINLKKVNDVQYINKFFETVNRKLPVGGLFMSFVETKNLRKKRILNKYPKGVNHIVYSLNFLVRRVLPKFYLTRRIFFFLTRGQSRVLSRAETLGRLYSCGFSVRDEKEIDGLYYFVAEKKDSPAYDMNPTYGPFITLNRVGKNGKMFKVYKFRTMHPYAEYLQDYVYQRNHLAEGGKFKDDFRVTTVGKMMRKLWLDELPMFINLLKGEMKIVGVRPISKHYFNLYSKELQEKRTQTKPGLLPPFYADMPKTLPEIEASEMRYLEAYEKRPVRTDLWYFWAAVRNILFKKARSN